VKHPIIVGLQYGDEGKGKITDLLAKQADWVVRFNGGTNAGHTLWLNGKKLVTHSVPSGILYPHVKNFIGAGCVIYPVALEKEFEDVRGAGVNLTPERLKVDFRAHITLPIHVALDGAREAGSHGIGTTKRGIGPTYTTKTDRSGVRAGDLIGPLEALEEKVRFLLKTFNPLLREAGVPESSFAENMQVVELARRLLRDFVATDPTPFYDAAKKSRCVLEGAQGILLDIDHGSFPFVTSSNTLGAYAAIGTPFPVSKLGMILGVTKAYLTRVGMGPMPTELEDETGKRIRQNGHEFGATTGRPRRVGWLNGDELRQAVRLCDCTAIALTKSDVLSGEPEVGVLFDGRLNLLPGWPAVTLDDKKTLHPNFEAFIAKIESFVGVPVIAMGTGPDRADILWRGANVPASGPEFWQG
jgi:adenylosuccinate synthase